MHGLHSREQQTTMTVRYTERGHLRYQYLNTRRGPDGLLHSSYGHMSYCGNYTDSPEWPVIAVGLTPTCLACLAKGG